MASSRRSLHFNPSARAWVTPPGEPTDLVDAFHQSLPEYTPTRLVSLHEVARELGVGAVYLKEESNRLGLPSFKSLGASWGAFRAVTKNLKLPLDSSITQVKEAAKADPTTVHAATAGNHGRAVARVGSLLGLTVRIFVPQDMHPDTIRLITDEGARLTVVPGSYDDAVTTAFAQCEENGGIMIQDTAFEGYEDVPSWIVQGYSTMMREIDIQLNGLQPDLVITPVGVGSFAQAVVSHYKNPGRSTSVLTVEPDTAACLWKSLEKGTATPLQTIPTIMAGMDCGTVSSIAWPILSSGVDASSTVSDHEAHTATVYLGSKGVSAGPCGAASLASLRRLSPTDKSTLGLHSGSVVVLLCTEGSRAYDIPKSVSSDDAASIAQTLVQINSASPSGGVTPGPGETAVARYIAAWLEHRDIETHWIEQVPGRPSVVGVVRGSGGGKSLMLNGHIDTVTLAGYDGDALSGHIKDGKLYGRGSADMKGSVAAFLAILVEAKRAGLRGDVIFTGVADEEDLSIGTEQVLQAGWRADAAIVGEPSNLDIVFAHKGFVWLQVDIIGVACHGSQPGLGVDAISKAGYFLVELDKYAQELQASPQQSALGTGSVHASLIKGGEEASSYPAQCTIVLERRTVTGETPMSVREEVECILNRISKGVSGFSYKLEVMFSRPTFEIQPEHAFVSLVAQHAKYQTGEAPALRVEPFWTDCALLAGKQIPVVIFGPYGHGLHAKEEWVDVKSVEVMVKTVLGVAYSFCT
ncbi:uncharacterized protein K452DRAFT_273629 [Aplosporella prunicola CBS 121167]|uniref:Probable succinyl-diaminopimelate desuccinylase n=1 Tax=Aplosporella prunicola CBS 121167 TaxID=1176127 RepID=A0A6A6BBR6_9PEZI|nr:uncharacterized protein K452DRAFT_273629 [Aplosporella prunicola CBS 121167]KAF2140803.1 hypothetical protein K452DRAFT_273629 [Aplosporella prunicola CBS 121167]